MQQNLNYNQISKQWWSQRRSHYNKGLVIAGITAFLLYVILGSFLIASYDPEFEITLFTTLIQGMGYLFMMGIANIFYNLGYTADLIFNKDRSEQFRLHLYRLGYWFSFGLPFLIPFLIVIEYFVVYKK